MKKNIFVIFTAFLAVVVVALLFTIATLQSKNSDLRNVVRNQINNSISSLLQVHQLYLQEIKTKEHLYC